MLLFIFIILVLSLIALFCVLKYNIIFMCYIYISDNKKILDKIFKYILLLKIFNICWLCIRSKTRIFYLVIEFILFIIGSIFWLCFKVLMVYYNTLNIKLSN